MKRAWWGLLVAIALGGLVLSLDGCPAAHEGFPDTSCKSNADCFKGETCMMNVCTVPPADLASDIALVVFDFSTLDGGDAGDAL